MYWLGGAALDHWREGPEYATIETAVRHGFHWSAVPGSDYSTSALTSTAASISALGMF